ncbi:4-hydroxy-tetrahydrodipicolinate reductase [Virgibacillus soli]|uniref:4-hydroxy-tetrahydrodipicolinate reductase n=1 Tax=Paracerasibacillus soli TaxID=480284 RepID=UPI0035EB650D
MTIKVILAGPRGKMGSEALSMISQDKELELVACIDRRLKQNYDFNVPVYTDAKECFQHVKADVLIDLTVPDVGYHHTKEALLHQIRPVVGTSGFTKEQVEELSQLAEQQKTGCIIAPNFAIGAVLMMEFAQIAAKYFPDVEIIEKHHDQKLDAPSGTAIKTFQMIQETRRNKHQGHKEETELIPGARGAEVDGIRVHSVRLPGLVAHHEIIFGGPGQTLTVQHDSYNRDSFMSGIKFSILKVLELQQLVYGLEHIIK